MNYVDWLRESALAFPENEALKSGTRVVRYRQLFDLVYRFGSGIAAADLGQGERVAVLLEKSIENVVAIFGISAAGGCCVPINPVLKPLQVQHILADSGARMLVTSSERARILSHANALAGVTTVVIIDGGHVADRVSGVRILPWLQALETEAGASPPTVDTDMALIMYTSGSTGRPKGVVLSHRNVIEGARSVSSYLGIADRDRIPTLLPLSFDAGFNQLTTALSKGACVLVFNYIHAAQVVDLFRNERPTCMTAVPPLWHRISSADWSGVDTACVRVFANTGGHMPLPLLGSLRSLFPEARPFLMYGLTEAFRSTFLDPDEVDRRPGSIGKAIPNARIFVLREDGTEASPGEPGELVHCGAHVALGYWNNPAETARKFREVPKIIPRPASAERAVWSGDVVRRDAQGFLYFIGRKGEMIKTRGHRVSPGEIEETILASGLVREVAAFGYDDETDGELIAAAVVLEQSDTATVASLQTFCRKSLPSFMQPSRIFTLQELPRNPNGKIDRANLPQIVNGEEHERASANG